MINILWYLGFSGDILLLFIMHAVGYKFLEKRGKDRIVKEEMHRNLNK